MTALLKYPQHNVKPSTPDIAWERLNLLRVHFARHRCAARLDLFEACRLITPDASTVTMETFVRCLAQALDRSPVVYAAGTQTLSFDEAWILRVIDACAANDADSLTFLTVRRIRPHKRRAFLFLLRQLIEQCL